MKRTITALLLGVALVLFTSASAQAADCEFRLGFKTLRDLIGHDTVGECLENEHYNEISDSNQQTTGGLMAWRKADNWTAFTDGYRTWINGPNGLVQRLNTERFSWEADYAQLSPTVAPTEISPSPTPTPFSLAQVETLIKNPELVVRVVLAKGFNAQPSDPRLQMWMERLESKTWALPYIYLMHLLSVGGPDSGHPLVDVEAFTTEYVKYPQSYAMAVRAWIDGVRASPCSTSEEVKSALIALETKEPGALDVAIVRAQHAPWAAEPAARAISIGARAKLFDDPDVFIELYECG